MALGKCKECGRELSDKADRCPHCGWTRPTHNGRWIAFALLVLLIVAGLTSILSSPRSGRSKVPSRTIAVTLDTSVADLLERLHSRRPAMDVLVSKERDPERRLNASDERTSDAFYTLSDSIDSRITRSITGLKAATAGGRALRLVSFLWETPAPETRVCFWVSINYGGSWGGAGFPSREAAVADIEEVALRVVPRLFEFYPRLEEIHLHEHVNSFVVATLVIRRNNVPSPTEEPEDFRRFVELNQALVKMGKL